MDLETDSVDCVLCRWGYMLMINRAAAFAETRRVLRPGGRLAFSVFAVPERNPWASLVGRVLVKQGHIPPPDPEIEEVSFCWTFANYDGYWRFLTEVAGAIAFVLQSLPPEVQAQAREQVHEAAEPFRSGEGYDLPAVCLNVVTR